MLHTKFHENRSTGSRDEDFEGFLPYMGMAAILVMWPRCREQNFVFGSTIWLWLTKHFRRRRSLNWLTQERTDAEAWYTISSPCEPKSSDEVKRKLSTPAPPPPPPPGLYMHVYNHYFQTPFSLKPLGQSTLNFMWASLEGRKELYSNGPGHMTKMTVVKTIFSFRTNTLMILKLDMEHYVLKLYFGLCYINIKFGETCLCTYSRPRYQVSVYRTHGLLSCLRLYVPANNFSVILGRLSGLASTEQWGLGVLLKDTTSHPRWGSNALPSNQEADGEGS